ncbi:hypothetical protein AAFF_G00283860 [Aldrovandia affinis]|uniref:Uncharacterized protein n=1 Tax=Aldrovandia affinis TaxID=143900 RepID=A0AAD7TA28_9TELE|nr:hypothetical protein AAFF_G00283860 [Aldrovandia affinis]
MTPRRPRTAGEARRNKPLNARTNFDPPPPSENRGSVDSDWNRERTQAIKGAIVEAGGKHGQWEHNVLEDPPIPILYQLSSLPTACMVLIVLVEAHKTRP